LKSNADYSVRKPANILKKGDFSSFFALNFVGSKTGELEPNAICRAIDSLRNCIYGCAQEFQNMTSFFHDFCAIEAKSDESWRKWGIEIFISYIQDMIEFSMGYPNLRLKFRMVQHRTKNWSKYKMGKNGENRFTQKIAVSVAQYLNPGRSILDSNESSLETKMISDRSSTNPVSLS
jgi:hypothetical protein